MDATAIERSLARISHEIVERNPDSENLAFLGLHTRGFPLAQRLAKKVGILLKNECLVGKLDVSMHRDDIAMRSHPPKTGVSKVLFDVADKIIILVDDVLFTGRTIRAALDEISDFGRPSNIQLAILVDRGHRELPIRPDFVGRNVPTARTEYILVRLTEIDGKDEVILEK